MFCALRVWCVFAASYRTGVVLNYFVCCAVFGVRLLAETTVLLKCAAGPVSYFHTPLTRAQATVTIIITYFCSSRQHCLCATNTYKYRRQHYDKSHWTAPPVVHFSCYADGVPLPCVRDSACLYLSSLSVHPFLAGTRSWPCISSLNLAQRLVAAVRRSVLGGRLRFVGESKTATFFFFVYCL